MSDPAFVINGWAIYAHTLFLDQLEEYQASYRAVRKKHPNNYQGKKATKLYGALLKTAFEVIPADPTNTSFRQGSTLGDANAHWFRAKFLQQFRLFFRYSAADKIIVLAWVNDEDTLRAYGSKTDAYVVFKKMLEDDNPPGSWDALLAACSSDQAVERLKSGTSRD